MTESEDLLKEPNLIRCAVKKTTSVLLKHTLYASYVIVALAVLGIVYPAITGILIPPPVAAITSMIATLLEIAWYRYAIMGIVVAYFGYGFLWCIARDLTEEDWKSKAANNSVALAILVIAFAAFAAFAFASSSAITVVIAAALAIAIAFAAALAILVIAIAAALAVLVIDPVDKITVWYYVFRFVGAAWHHYHEKKSEPIEPKQAEVLDRIE